MIASLLDLVGGKSAPGRLYTVLWSYEFGDGFVDVPDPVLLALEAGHLTSRAERSFLERMAVLRDLGFIRTSAVGTREFRHVLLRDPNRAVVELRASQPERVPQEWWSAFTARCSSIGIELPSQEAADAGFPGAQQ